eukprot:scaffold361464_cov18-Prasinocladus_malaysianus.AAC.1
MLFLLSVQQNWQQSILNSRAAGEFSFLSQLSSLRAVSNRSQLARMLSFHPHDSLEVGHGRSLPGGLSRDKYNTCSYD